MSGFWPGHCPLCLQGRGPTEEAGVSERGSIWKRRLDFFLGIPLVGLTSLVRKKKAKPWKIQDSPNLRVGFICLGAIGDLLLLSALICALRRRLPRASFYLLTSRANAQAARLLPGIDEKRAFALWQIPAMLCYLRRSKLDLLFDSSQWARLGTVLANCSGATLTIGFTSQGQWRSLGLDYAVPHRSDQHEVENFLDLGRALFPNLSAKPCLVEPQAFQVRSVLKRALESPRAIYAHMWPSGIFAWRKAWPEAYWVSLLLRLEALSFTLFLTGSAQDRAANEAFLSAHPNLHATSLAGEVSLTELALLFRKSSAVISVNTGTMHLAALCGATTVGLHGPTNPLRWGPYGPRVSALLPRRGLFAYLDLGFEYPKNYRPCLQHLLPEDVFAVLQTLGVIERKVPWRE